MTEKFDEVIVKIADYVDSQSTFGEEAYRTASYCLMDAIGCALLSLCFADCSKLLGPIVPGTIVPNGCRVPGTHYVLDPAQGAFNIGSMIRWLDYNDTWLAAEWGHPSDNLGAILAIADYLSQEKISKNSAPFLVRDILEAMIKTYEIQGVLALENAFNRVGLDHVILVKVASAAVIAKMLGGSKDTILNTISNAWVDGHALRTYRHAPNTGPRKSWAAGDATRRAVELAMICAKGEPGYPTALTAKTWGFNDVLFKATELSIPRPFASYVIENILFKVSYPAEFHAQTAVEAALRLHPQVAYNLDSVEKILITTHESAMRIIDKRGPLRNPADRDHCLQYMVAVALVFGELAAENYGDQFACDPRIDQLRERMTVVEDKQFSKDYLDPDKRSIANALQITFKNGTVSERVQVDYPLGHRVRREESIPQLVEKFHTNVLAVMPEHQAKKIFALFADYEKLLELPVPAFMEQLVI